MNTGRKSNIFIKILQQQKDGLAKKGRRLKKEHGVSRKTHGALGKGRSGCPVKTAKLEHCLYCSSHRL